MKARSDTAVAPFDYNDMSHVMIFIIFFIYFFFPPDKVPELNGGGYVINRAYPV